ncbi:MAG TPA: arginase family protein, partial [Streptosporangiaceae bacterium]|nr:arginase family protein [Streptosporangiaceae bacterium]
MSDWVIIGVPSSAGAHHAGQERAPAALRQAGLPDRLRAAGLVVDDAGDLPGAVFAVDHDHAGARNLPAVARVARETADAVAAAAGAGRLPLVIGGDCTITLGVIAG